MRASRLVNVLLLLQTRSRMTAAELAEELEVSVRTIYRDVEALAEAGVPIYAERGPHGGVRLVDGYRTRLTGLTADEAEAVFLSGLPGPAAELGLGTVVAAARLKVMAALPPELRARASRVAERFHLDAPGWFHASESLPHLEVLAAAVWENRSIMMRYRRGERGGVVERHVDPYRARAEGRRLVPRRPHRRRLPDVPRLAGRAGRADHRPVRAAAELRPGRPLGALNRSLRAEHRPVPDHAPPRARSGSMRSPASPARGSWPPPRGRRIPTTRSSSGCGSRSTGWTRPSAPSSAWEPAPRSSSPTGCGIPSCDAAQAIVARYSERLAGRPARVRPAAERRRRRRHVLEPAPAAPLVLAVALRGADPLGLRDLARSLVEDRPQQLFGEHTCPFPRFLHSVIDGPEPYRSKLPEPVRNQAVTGSIKSQRVCSAGARSTTARSDRSEARRWPRAQTRGIGR